MHKKILSEDHVKASSKGSIYKTVLENILPNFVADILPKAN
jgi:hypothetical protein